MRLIFAGTPDFAVPALQTIARRHEVVAVLTQPDRRAGRGKKLMPPAVKVAATELGLEVFQPASLKDQQAFIETFQADVMVVVAYGLLLPQAILDAPKHGCLNIHASLLPRWRGAAPIQRAIEAGDQATGICIMQMEAGLDTGPVLNQQSIPIDKTDTSISLQARLAKLGAECIEQTLHQISQGQLPPAQPQDHAQASYAHKITKGEAEIDWSESAQQIEQRIRAFTPWPICQTQHQGQRLRIWEAFVDSTDLSTNKPSGTVIDVSTDGIVVACGSGALSLQTLQRDGGKALDIRTFSNGYQIQLGDSLG